MLRQYYEQDIRKRQIDTLKIFNDNVTEVKENAEYRVDFTSNGVNMSLEVILPSEFPSEKPIIFVNPKINHPWVSETNNMVVSAPGLLNFTLHSDLGRVVQAIKREFSKNIEDINIDVKSVQITSAIFPELDDLSIDDLQELYQNEDLQDKLLETHPVLLQLDIETQKVIESIEEIAKANLSKQQDLENAKTEVIDSISKIVQLKHDYEELNKKHQKLCEAYDPYKIRDTLQEAALKADEEAEVIAEKFLKGEIPVEEFVKEFADKRGLGQVRRARAERLSHQLAQLDRTKI